MSEFDLLRAALVAVAYVLLLCLAALLFAIRSRTEKASRVAGRLGAGAIAGAAAGSVLLWVVRDAWAGLDAPEPWVTATVIIAGAVFVGIAVAGFVGGRPTGRVVATLVVLVALFVTGTSIRVDLEDGPANAEAARLAAASPTPTPTPTDPPTVEDWQPPADMPEEGVVRAVDIPSSRENYVPRTAYLYLPPAALVANPPDLPVVMAMSGQPGSPEDVFGAGDLASVLDGIAEEHRGLAPIVVVPDQLTDPDHNPMCVDGALGDSANYLTVDVPRWIVKNLPATRDHSRWTIAGFSQGGTCSVQLGGARPDLFGSIVDISGEFVPSVGSEEDTIDEGFGGDEAAYEAATPEQILATHGPYSNYIAYFASGEYDVQFTGYVEQVSELAEQAGMIVTREISPGTGHDWNTARWGFERGFTLLLGRWGITS